MSRQYFDFSSLIADFANPFQVVTHTESGYNAAGDWQEGKEQITAYSFKIGFLMRSSVQR